MVKLSEGWGKLRPSKFLLPDITDFFTSLGGCTLTFGISQVFIAESGVEEGVVALAAGLDFLMRFPLFSSFMGRINLLPRVYSFLSVLRTV